ncbi:diguanylate cyclase [Nocardia brasiliensis]|uniref:Diguanylate cyclase n=1 Tax=Nocardia brasiliensis TaxID=37326 RepID=A0A6G9XV38_NOCBR|nr:GGDEF domain-containing protein [Nocardia brasiliensis]QIS04693.1 diguanylate cyclase [Nocardia brasiliensis]
MTDIRRILRAWWRERVDYRWLVETFASHSALAALKLMVGTAGLVMMAITLLALASRAGQSGPIGVTQAVAVSVLAGLWTVRWWLLPWPSERESLVWVAAIDVGITANNILVQDRLLGALGIVLLATTGGYVTIFHGPRILAWHLGWSLLSIVLLAVLLVLGMPGGDTHATGDPALAVGVVLANIAVTGVVLPVVQFCHWLLRLDALSDPLTRLLNRRGLDSRLAQYTNARRKDPIYVVIIDLDRFKSVNDTAGHSLGDEVLVRTADCLRAAVPPDAVIARTGGDEFVVVGKLGEQAVGELAERVRRAIAALPIPITASIGTAVSVCRAAATVRDLFRHADSAMYRAKQLGGNTVVAGQTGASPQRVTD